MVVVGVLVVGDGLAADIALVVVVGVLVVGDGLAADIALVVVVGVLVVGDDFAAGVALVILVGVLVVGDGLAADVAQVVVVGVLVVGDGLAADIADVILVSVLVVGDNLAAGITDVITVFIGMRQRFGMAGAAGAGAGVGTVAVGCPRTPVVVVGVNSTIGLATGRTDSLCCAGSRAAGAGVDNIFTDLQLLAAVIEDLLAGVREEIAAVICVIGVGKYHGVVRVFGGHADRRAEGHGPADGQRLAGGQIHIVGLVRNRVALDNGDAADVQLAGILGTNINPAAAAVGFISADRTIGEIADRAGAVNIHTAAVAGGRIAGDLTARHVQHRRFLIQIDGTAVAAAAIVDDLAAGEIEGAVCIQHFNRTALGGLVAADLAAGHVEYRSLIRIGAQADGAAPAACGIAGEPCAVGNGDRAPAHKNGAAVQTGRIAGDLGAAGNGNRAAAAHVDGAAAGIVAAHGRFIAGDGAAGQIDAAAGGGEERTAVLGGVILDGAAVHIESAAGGVRLVCIEFPENGAAVVIAVVAGDITAVHVEYALLVIHGDGSAAATFGDFTAGELTAEHVQSAGVEVNAAAAPDVLRCALDGAAALTVAENKPGVISHFDLLFAVGGQCLAVQAQIQRPAVNDQIAVEGGIACQIDIGGIVGIRNAAGAVPCRIGHIGMGGMVARVDIIAADAVGVRRLYGDALVGGLHRGLYCGFIRVGSAGIRLFLIRGLGRFVLCRSGVLAAALHRRAFRAADGAIRVHALCRAGGFTDAYYLLLLLLLCIAGRGVLAIGEYRHRQQAQRQRQCQQDRK